MSIVKNISMRSLFTALSYYSKHEASCFRVYVTQINAKGNERWLKIEKKSRPVARPSYKQKTRHKAGFFCESRRLNRPAARIEDNQRRRNHYGADVQLAPFA